MDPHEGFRIDRTVEQFREFWGSVSRIRSRYAHLNIDAHPFIEDRPPFPPCFPGSAPHRCRKLSPARSLTIKFSYLFAKGPTRIGPTARRPSASAHGGSG